MTFVYDHYIKIALAGEEKNRSASKSLKPQNFHALKRRFHIPAQYQPITKISAKEKKNQNKFDLMIRKWF